MRRRSYRWVLAILASAALPSLSGCATTADHRTLRVVVTNDDGVAAPGIDTLVRTLDELPDVDVRVFAPASDRSGTGQSQSGRVLFGTVSKTRSGHPAVAVPGFPADTMLYADRAGVLANADVVVSGVNWGENLGAIIDHSGTIGAARTAARLGLPALAVSQGAGDPPDFASGAALAAQWLEDHRTELLDGTAPPIVTSINVPTCPSGTVRGLMAVPVSVHPESSDHGAPDCASPLGKPVVDADDVDAFLLGFATLSTFDGDLRPVG